MQRERDLLFDLGYIYINYALGIDATFIKENDVFSIPVTDKNRVVLKGEDLYKCGYWLEKQKMGSFICQHCGNEFAHYSKNKNEWKRKYCKKCGDELAHNKKSGELKIIHCIDCGDEVKISKFDNKTCRCMECYEVYRLNYKKEKEKQYRQSKTMDRALVFQKNCETP